MPDEDFDDYLSDKFIVETKAATSSTKTYSQLRKDAATKSKLKNDQNRVKSRRERELEAREEGLSKSLFERAKEEEQKSGGGSGNKALSMMMKMGFQPGQSLGRPSDGDASSNLEISSIQVAPENTKNKASRDGHRTEPLPLSEWSGKEGIGASRKRALSPNAAGRVAKMAKMAEESSKEDFRDRAKRDYEERRAEGRLGPAQGTCTTLDETAGIPFNVLWLNLGNPSTFPPGLIEALSLHTTLDIRSDQEHQDDDLRIRLRKQMESDAYALQSISHDDDGDISKLNTTVVNTEFSQSTLEESQQFLRLQARDRLRLVISYLRDHHAYCFWCGTQYDDQEDMENHCPGPEEDSHD